MRLAWLLGLGVISIASCLFYIQHHSVTEGKSLKKHDIEMLPSGPDSVVVKLLESPCPADPEEGGKFLWDTFANKPEEQRFSSYTTKNWRKVFTAFSDALIQKAEAQHLESNSLRKVLDLVQADAGEETAYLPVGAYRTTQGDNPVWIVVVKWEYASDDGSSLGHICIFSFDQTTLEMTGRCSCG